MSKFLFPRRLQTAQRERANENVFWTAEYHVTGASRNLGRGLETPQLPREFAERVEPIWAAGLGYLGWALFGLGWAGPGRAFLLLVQEYTSICEQDAVAHPCYQS